VNSLNQSLDAANAENARLAGVNSDTLAEIEKIGLDLSSKDAVLHEKDMELEALRETHSQVKKDLQTEVKAKEAALKQVEDLRARLALLNGDKDIIVNKLADDLGKVMEEMQKVQDQLPPRSKLHRSKRTCMGGARTLSIDAGPQSVEKSLPLHLGLSSVECAARQLILRLWAQQRH